MMNTTTWALAAMIATLPFLPAQGSSQKGFDQAAASTEKRLEESLAELTRVRESISAEKIGLSKELADLQAKMQKVRMRFEEKVRLVDSTTLDLDSLRNQIQRRQEETGYLANLMSEYLRNFESRLHVTELQRFSKQIEKAKLAAEDSTLSESQVFEAQAGIIQTSLNRLEEDLGGSRFAGSVIDSTGLVSKGLVTLFGPIGLFRSDNGKEVGLAELRLGSVEPTLIPFAEPADREQASKLVESGTGILPVDPTLGDAYMTESTQETLWQELQKGGPVMIPILALAVAALLVALWRWLVLLSIRKPSRTRIDALMLAVQAKDRTLLKESLRGIKGPSHEVLEAGVEHIDEPREIIEEVMFEQVLKTKLAVQRFLPFIAISAASAPLLGLLGTVTGIINTFKLITIHGSGDVKMLSGGISEALITTKFGLVVAIPSLLIHAYLSRKAKGIVSDMERTALRFTNEVSLVQESKATQIPTIDPDGVRTGVEPQTDLVRKQVQAILGEMLEPLRSGGTDETRLRNRVDPVSRP